MIHQNAWLPKLIQKNKPKEKLKLISIPIDGRSKFQAGAQFPNGLKAYEVYKNVLNTLDLKQLRNRCTELGVCACGSKAKLISRILDEHDIVNVEISFELKPK